jgi:GAF domain-containing protein
LLAALACFDCNLLRLAISQNRHRFRAMNWDEDDRILLSAIRDFFREKYSFPQGPEAEAGRQFEIFQQTVESIVSNMSRKAALFRKFVAMRAEVAIQKPGASL